MNPYGIAFVAFLVIVAVICFVRWPRRQLIVYVCRCEGRVAVVFWKDFQDSKEAYTDVWSEEKPTENPHLGQILVVLPVFVFKEDSVFYHVLVRGCHILEEDFQVPQIADQQMKQFYIAHQYIHNKRYEGPPLYS